MKKLLLFICLLYSSVVLAQCPPNPLSFNTQADIDNFAINYPGCTEYPFDISLVSSEITSLLGFSGLNSIGGNLSVITAVNLSSLAGLENLSSISGYLRISSTQLSDITPLNNVSSIGDYIRINSNNQFTNLSGFNALTSVGGSLLLENNSGITQVNIMPLIQTIGALNIESNSSLTSIGPWNSLTSVNGDFKIEGCNSLSDLPLMPNLSTIAGDLAIISNNGMVNLTGFNGLNNIGGAFIINNNNLLSSLNIMPGIESAAGIEIIDNISLGSIGAWNNLMTIDGDLTVENCDALVNLPSMTNLNAVTGEANFRLNEALVDLAGLDGLTSIGSIMRIEHNSNLLNVNGLENLTTIGGSLLIWGNDVLNQIDALDGLQSVEFSVLIGGTFTTTDPNPLLASITLAQLSSVGNDFIIRRNEEVTTLSEINALETVGGIFYVANNSALTNISGFNSLTMAGEGVRVFSNLALEELAGFSSLINLNDRLLVKNNHALLSITGFQNLETVDGFFLLQDCDLLNSIEGFTSLTTVTNEFSIGSSSSSGAQGLPELQSLNGLQNLTDVQNDVTIKDCESLINLSGLDNLQFIDGEFNLFDNDALLNLTGLESLETINGDVLIANPAISSLQGLSGLTTINRSFFIDANPMLTNLSGLENLTYIDGQLRLYANDNMVSFEGLDSLEEVGALHIWNMPAIQSFEGMEALTRVNNTATYIVDRGELKIENASGLTSLNGLQNLNTVYSLRFTVNLDLTDISGISNIDVGVLERIFFANNTSLSNCSILSICNYLLLPNADINLGNNATGCNTLAEIADGCADSFNIISGEIRIDSNQDGCDPLDISASNIAVTSTDGTDNFTTFTDSEGNYVQYLYEGTYTTGVSSNVNYFIFTPPNLMNTFTGFGNEFIADFCMEPDGVFNDLNITLFPLEDARPGFETSYRLVYSNVGNTLLSGTVAIQFDENSMTFENAIPSPDGQTSNSLQWNFVDLNPYETRFIDLDMLIFEPPIVEDGDELLFEATIMPINDDETPEDNLFELIQIVVNSQDPNDKIVLEGDQVLIEEADEFLHYIVRFQNVGTASAINVRIEDLLDEKLDLNTLQLIDYSHMVQVQQENDFVTFTFDDINLPPEVNDPEGSNGYVVYKIKPLSTIVLGDTVENTADIYFDFNAPITTNTVSTTFVELLGVEGLEKQKPFLYPNPVTRAITIHKPAEVELIAVKIYNVAGAQLLHEDIDNSSIDVTELSSGVYFIEISTSEGFTIKRFIKK